MDQFKTTFSNTRYVSITHKINLAADLYDIEEDEGSDHRSRTPTPSEELQVNQTEISESDLSSADDRFSRGKMADDLDAVYCEIKRMQETEENLKKELESLQKHHEQYKTEVIKALQEGKEKYSALEQKLIDTTELSEGNFSDMKEDLICIQDEIDNRHQETTYVTALENCHTRLLHMEQEQQQQEFQTETARPQVMALAVLELVIRALLVFMSITLNLVSTLSHIVLLLKPSGRILSALVFAIILHFTWKYWDSFSVLEFPEKGRSQ